MWTTTSIHFGRPIWLDRRGRPHINRTHLLCDEMDRCGPKLRHSDPRVRGCFVSMRSVHGMLGKRYWLGVLGVGHAAAGFHGQLVDWDGPAVEAGGVRS